jgi:hypothetical protein
LSNLDISFAPNKKKNIIFCFSSLTLLFKINYHNSCNESVNRKKQSATFEKWMENIKKIILFYTVKYLIFLLKHPTRSHVITAVPNKLILIANLTTAQYKD